MGFKYGIPRYKILAERDLTAIKDISLDILENIGVRVPSIRMLEILYDNGAIIDKKKQIARIPGDMVLDSIKKASKKHILYGRNRHKKAEFGYGMFNFNGSGGQYRIVDRRSRHRRSPTVEDLAMAVRIGDALENINIVGSMVVPSDVPAEHSDIITFYHLLSGTTKPFTGWIFSKDSAKIIIEMMQAVAGDEQELKRFPFYELFIEPVSPLSYTEESLEVLFEFIVAGLPVGFSPMVQIGATGPCSIAGALSQENAEILSGITISQLINPGLPVSYGGIPHVFDMRVQEISFGSPEQALMAAAMIQIGKSYNFPVYSNTGLSDSKCMDAQYGIESAATLAWGTLSGSDVFGHLGIIGADNGASFTQLIIDNEIAGYFIRILSGFDTGGLEEAYQQIVSEGIGGNFLVNELTVRNFKKEIWYPELLDRRPWDTWNSNGAKDIIDMAIKKEEFILKNHKALPLEEDKLADLKKILKKNNIVIKEKDYK